VEGIVPRKRPKKLRHFAVHGDSFHFFETEKNLWGDITLQKEPFGYTYQGMLCNTP
jgi:hypothetical protein